MTTDTGQPAGAQHRWVAPAAIGFAAGVLVATAMAYVLQGKESPAPQQAPAAAPAASTTAPAASATADSLLQRSDLGGVVLDIPAWGYIQPGFACDTGKVTLSALRPDLNRHSVVAVAHTNLDGDPALETAALLFCDYGSNGLMTGLSYQVVAFERNSAGKIVTIGQVMAGPSDQSGQTQVVGIEPLPDGGVKVYSGGTDPVLYKWVDNGFRQVTS
jgi:hypothetical protein